MASGCSSAIRCAPFGTAGASSGFAESERVPACSPNSSRSTRRPPSAFSLTLAGTARWASAGTATRATALVPKAALQRSPPVKPALREALQWWRNLASHARALLNAAAQLFKGRVDDLTLARLNPGLFLSPPLLLRAARRDPASFVAYGMELWLRFFQVRPRAIYNRRRKRFEVRIGGSPPLAGALALQIMLALTRWSGIAVCSSCGRLFPPSRRPNPNRNTYCDACGIRAAWREAQARRRERKLTNRKAERGQRHPSISRRH